MTGPEHWSEAERLIAGPTFRTARQGVIPSADPAAVAVAQVHATLATAAAFLAVAVIRPGDRGEWDRAMGIKEWTP